MTPAESSWGDVSIVRFLRWANVFWTIFWLALTVPILLSVSDHPHPVWCTVFVVLSVACLIGSWLIAIDRLRTNLFKTSSTAVVLFGAGAGAALVALGLMGEDCVQLLYFVVYSVAFVFPWQVSLPLIAAATLLLPHSEWPYGFVGVAATGGACLASRISIINQAKKKILEEQAQELEVNEERNRMARDMHDILGHSLTSVTLKAELAEKLIDIEPPAARTQIKEIEQISRSALAEVRATINGYRELSLSGELARAANLLHSAGIRTELPTSIDDVNPELRNLFAWAVREGTTNVARHSHAKRCRVRLLPESVIIEDDGVGVSEVSEGGGLQGLRDRCLASGVHITLAESDLGGLKLIAWSPSQDKEE